METALVSFSLWLRDVVGPAAAPWVGEIFVTDRFLSNLDFFFKTSTSQRWKTTKDQKYSLVLIL